MMFKRILFSIGSLLISVVILAEARDYWIQPDRVIKEIGITKGMKIGVAGAGKGYFTFKMAKIVGNTGHIYANEIDPEKIKYIKEKYIKESINNITTVLGKVKDPMFPDKSLDMVFMCYVFHDLSKPVAFLKNIKKYLKPGATVVILDQDPDKTGSSHFYKKKELLNKVEQAEYKVVQIETFLEKDNIYICQPWN